ncbi:hypothetical protein NIES2098_11180 [Calothrix sp. NIES-2098]|nr:hypothetical protein NIES2098_11180 [Calothrix sp. NIES-2098]
MITVQVEEAFYNYGRSYQILAVGTHAKSLADLEIMLRWFDRSKFTTLGTLSMCMYASSVRARMIKQINHKQLQAERSNRH